jgi:hypothetical protein
VANPPELPQEHRSHRVYLRASHPADQLASRLECPVVFQVVTLQAFLQVNLQERLLEHLLEHLLVSQVLVSPLDSHRGVLLESQAEYQVVYRQIYPLVTQQDFPLVHHVDLQVYQRVVLPHVLREFQVVNRLIFQ